MAITGKIRAHYRVFAAVAIAFLALLAVYFAPTGIVGALNADEAKSN
jgi:hypothetical protein